nr:hypothetical protein CFP56_30551 [Quercus suber]
MEVIKVVVAHFICSSNGLLENGSTYVMVQAISYKNKQQIDEALAEAKRQSDAQHKIQIDEMMADVRSMFDSMRSFPNASQLPVVHWEFSSMRYAFVVLFACLEVDVDNCLYIRVVALWTKSLEMG